MNTAAEYLAPQTPMETFSPYEVQAMEQLHATGSETLLMAYGRATAEWRAFNRHLTPEQLASTGAEREELLRQDRLLLNRDAAIVTVLLERNLLRWGVDNFELDETLAELSQGNPNVDAALRLSETVATAGRNIFDIGAMNADMRLDAATAAAINWSSPLNGNRGSATERLLFYRQMTALRNTLNSAQVLEMHRRVGEVLNKKD